MGAQTTTVLVVMGARGTIKKNMESYTNKIPDNMPIHNDREIAANNPDIIIRDHTNQKCQIIDMAVPSDRNTSIKVVKKLSIIIKTWKLKLPECGKQEQRQYQLSLVHLGSLRRDWKSTLTKSQAKSASINGLKKINNNNNNNNNNICKVCTDG